MAGNGAGRGLNEPTFSNEVVGLRPNAAQVRDITRRHIDEVLGYWRVRLEKGFQDIFDSTISDVMDDIEGQGQGQGPQALNRHINPHSQEVEIRIDTTISEPFRKVVADFYIGAIQARVLDLLRVQGIVGEVLNDTLAGYGEDWDVIISEDSDNDGIPDKIIFTPVKPKHSAEKKKLGDWIKGIMNSWFK